MFRSVRPESKSCDEYPDVVTEADRAAERAIRALITLHYPQHAIIGEEYGITGDPASQEWCWVLDPVDGTRDFTCGNHTWGTLIAVS